MGCIFPILDRKMDCNVKRAKISLCQVPVCSEGTGGAGEGKGRKRESLCVLQKPLNNQRHKCLFL